MNARGTTFSPRRAGRIAVWVVGALLVVGTLMALWVGVRGALAYQHLSTIRSLGPEAASTLAADPAEATSVIERLATEADAAHDLTSDVVWSVAERAPWIGPQLEALGTISSASDRLFGDSLLPLATATTSDSLNALRPKDGRLDTAALSRLAAPTESAAAASALAARDVDDLDPTPLLGTVASAVDQAQELFTTSAHAIDALHRATKLLPTMLGENGPRTYLLLVQNNAEWRSLGGISGTTILLRAEGGAVSLSATRSATELSRGLTQPVVALPSEITEIYGTRPAQFVHNLTEIPDFTVDGPLAQEMYRAQTGAVVDGVIAVDPVALSYLLAATGPVALPDGESLASDNAVPLLLSAVYERFPDPAAQNAYFAGATGAVFEALMEGRGSTPGLLAALARATEERRILAWSADESEQALLDNTVMAGRLPVTDEHTARFGVYLNDGTGSKMSYYVEPTVTLDWGSCGSDDRELSLTVELTNTAAQDAATTLPTYVTGNGVYGTAPGAATVVGNIYMPEGWDLVSATTTSGNGYTQATLEGRQVLTFGPVLPAQSSTTITVTVASRSSARDAEALVTPTADASLRPTVQASCVLNARAGLQ